MIYWQFKLTSSKVKKSKVPVQMLNQQSEEEQEQEQLTKSKSSLPRARATSKVKKSKSSLPVGWQGVDRICDHKGGSILCKAPEAVVRGEPP